MSFSSSLRIAPTHALDVHKELGGPFGRFDLPPEPVLEAGAQAFIQADAGGRVIEWNDHAAALLAHHREEVTGKRLCDTVFRWRDSSVWAALSRLASALPSSRESLRTLCKKHSCGHGVRPTGSRGGRHRRPGSIALPITSASTCCAVRSADPGPWT